MKCKPVDLSWLAALIDGEGWIGIVERRGQAVKLGLSRVPLRSIVAISNTDLRLMQALQKRFKVGKVYKHIRSGVSATTKKVAYTWRVEIKHQRVLLPQVLPYLVLKKQQAKLLITFLDLAAVSKNSGPGLQRQYNRKTAILAKIRKLNKKGPK